MHLHRRGFLGAAACLAAPRMAFAQAATERRMVFILQRGAADGLDTVVPYADPAYAKWRGALAIDPGQALRLDGNFALHPALVELHRLFGEGQATFFHAVASPYRDRSHFDGQNVLETGGHAPYQVKDGWMNRLLAMLPRHGKEAIAFVPVVPAVLRGAIEVPTYVPTAVPHAGDDLMQRVTQLYAQDARLHALWSAALEARGMADGMGAMANRQDMAGLGRMAAGFLARADGPRLALIETQGWDTHSAQAPRLAGQLRNLDRLIVGLREGMGVACEHTAVMVATEFGRTVAANGTGGTDHGTGAVAMLLGGAVQGGRVVADWPGLAPGQLLEGRDLQPTLALDTLIAAVCAQTYGLDPERVRRVLFPYGTGVQTLPRLLRA